MPGFVPVGAFAAGSDPGTLTLVAARGTYTLTGQSANVGLLISLTAAQGSYALTGQTAGLKAGRKIIASQGSYALSGQAASFRIAGKITAAYGAYVFTGEPALPKLDTTMANLFPGMYALIGQDVEMERTTHWTDEDCTDSPWTHDECDCH